MGFGLSCKQRCNSNYIISDSGNFGGRLCCFLAIEKEKVI